MAIWQIWLIAALVFFIIEIFTSGIAVICFSAGALASAVAALCGASFTWQVIFFAIFTILAFIFLRPLIIKLFMKNGKSVVKTNAEAIIGRQGIVSERICDADNTGRVKIDGDDWKAVSKDRTTIEVGEKVRVLKLDSIIVTVQKIN